MKIRTLVCAVAALCGGVASAQGNFNVPNNTVPQEWNQRPDRGDVRDRSTRPTPPAAQSRDRRSDASRSDRPEHARGDRSGYVRGDRPGYGRDDRPGYGRDDRPGYGRDDRPGYGRDVRRGDDDGYRRGYDGRRGAGPDHSFYRGSRLPREYRSHYYVVDDWRGHHLDAPPRGYHWVQTGSDYVLVAIATGLIAQIQLSN